MQTLTVKSISQALTLMHALHAVGVQATRTGRAVTFSATEDQLFDVLMSVRPDIG